jgi:hypothetical protein
MGRRGVEQLDRHWTERLRPRFEGLTDEEYLWQPVVGFAETSGTYFGGPPVDVRTFSYPGTAGEALRRLDAEYVAWLDGVRRLGVEGLAAPQGSTRSPEFADAPMARLVLYTHVEVIHHGAEVCLLRDLYARR